MSIPEFLASNETPTVFDNDSPSWTLPNGEDFAGWVGTSNLSRTYVYIWIETDDVAGIRRGSVEYRVFPFDGVGGDWQKLIEGDKVIRHQDGAELGAKFKLPEGQYAFEFRVEYEGQHIELQGGNFRLFRTDAERSANHDEMIRAFRALPREVD